MGELFWDLAYISGFTPWDTKEPPEEIIEYLNKGKIKPCRMLDIGCGKGYLVRFLAKNGFDAWGIDISSVAIKIAIKDAKKENINAKFFNIDFTDTDKVKELGKFKLITDIGCYHSLRNDKRDFYVKSLDEITEKGSIFMIWAFGKGYWGPPGIDENELEEKLSYKFKLIDKRQCDMRVRNGFFFVFEKIN
jgi:cyclopropane fatty-acyl-phospholipid synthase-like methyltransferase